MTPIEELAAFAADLNFDRLPSLVTSKLRLHLLDAVGCALASASTGAAAPVVDLVRAGSGAREAGVIGFEFHAPAAQAALATGTLIHALDYDDYHAPSMVHASAAVIAAALGAAEERACDGRTFLAALAAGFEIACRIGSALHASMKSMHLDPTGFAGTYGAAAAAARIWELPAPHMSNALGLSGAMSGGVVGERAGSSDVLRIRAGWAAATGVVAADLARRGFTGPLDLQSDPAIAQSLEQRWECMSMGLKSFPACVFVAAYASAAETLSIKPGDIAEIICVVAPSIVGVVCEPRNLRLAPGSDTQARFSLPFAVASALTGGRQPLDLFGEDARSDRRILGVAERVSYEIDSSMDPLAGKLIVSLKDGRSREAAEPIVLGHPDRPLTDEQILQKFHANARKRIEPAAAIKLADEIGRVHELSDLEELVSLAQVR